MDKYILDEGNSQWYERQVVAEQLKTSDQMAWVGMMNGIQASAAEIINLDLMLVCRRVAN